MVPLDSGGFLALLQLAPIASEESALLCLVFAVFLLILVSFGVDIK